MPNRDENIDQREKDLSLWQELGIPEPRFEEGEGPALSQEDWQDLRTFLRNEELAEEKERTVKINLVRWRSWSRAAVQAVLQFREERMEEGPPLSDDDFKLLEAYIRNELPDELDEDVSQKIERWRSWRRASDAIRKTIVD